MTIGTVACRRLLAGAVAGAVAISVAAPAAVLSALDPDLMATLELRDGYIDYDLEPGTLHFFDEGGQPLAVQISDGCAVNDHYWLFAAGLSGVPLPLSVTDLATGKDASVLLPAFDPDQPIGTIIDPEALPICADDVQIGGLPALDATATFTSANARGSDTTAALRLLSDGAERAYRRIATADETYRIITRGSPMAAVDTSADFDRLFLLTESRTPRSVEGVVFSGSEGMLPATGLDKALSKVTNARVRRAFETAKNGRVPQGIIGDLGLRRVQRVHHVDLDFETLGSAAYLAIAGWIKEGGQPIEPPPLVEERFSVELEREDGTRTTVPLTGPRVGSEAEGMRWEYGSEEALAQIIDTCRLSGSYWTWAGARTDEPLELVITDTMTGTSVSQPLWTERSKVSHLSDTSMLTNCP